MPTIPTLLLGLWVVATVLMYWRIGGRRAALVAMVGGWAILPTGDYPPEVLRSGRERGGPTHAVAIPAPPPFNKATAIGLGCLAGAVLFDRKVLRRLRPRWFDLPMALWLLAPFASSVSNGLPLADGLARSGYVALAWGVPYAVGRASFGDGPSLLAFSRTWVVAGLAYLPLGLAEFARAPFWYEALYGGHPYRFDGSDRWIGHRPLIFLEHGNQLGMWAATAAVAAAWLWALGELPGWRMHRLRIPGVAAVAALIAACLLWQSHGSILLMVAALVPLVARRWPVATRRTLIAVAASIVPALVVAIGWAIRVGPGGVREPVRDLFHGIGKASFTWRLARIVDHLPQLVQRPLMGWGLADWSARKPDGSFWDPIALSFWFLVTGLSGALGLLASVALLLLPIVGSWARLRRHASDGKPLEMVIPAAVILSLNVADLAFNSGFLLPMMLAAGGLTGWAFDRPRSPIESGPHRHSRPYGR